MDVSKNKGTPKWMVYNGNPEIPIKMDDLGVPLFWETPIYPKYSGFVNYTWILALFEIFK